MGGWYLLVYSYSFNQLKIKILLTFFYLKLDWSHVVLKMLAEMM